MPSVVVEIPDTYNAITRPVIVEVAKSLIKTMGLPIDTNLQFLGSSESAIQPGSTLTKPKENNTFPTSNKITIEATEEYISDRVLTTATKRNENKAFFRDNALGVYMRPVYVGTEITLSIRFRAKDKNTAERWKNEFLIRSSQGRVEMLHDLDYHYGIPQAFLVILSAIYDLRENVAGYGDTIQDWFKNSIVNRTTKLTNRAGEMPILVIAEEQLGALGWFEFVSHPENGNKDDDTGAWETGFDYKLVYDKVTAITFQYPLMVHNQLLDDKLRPSQKIYDLANTTRDPSWTRFLAERNNSIFNQSLTSRMAGVTIPEFDDWYPDYVPNFTSTIFTALLVVDENDPHAILNLGQLGDYSIAAPILDFLKTEARWLNLTSQSIFHIELYRWKKPLDELLISCDDDLEITTTMELDPRATYHFRLGITNDLTVLSKDALERLRNAPEAFYELIKLLDPAFANTCSAAFYTRLGFSYKTKLSDLFDDIPVGIDPELTLQKLICEGYLQTIMYNDPVLGTLLYKMLNELYVHAGLLPKAIGGKLISYKDITEIGLRISKANSQNPLDIEKRMKTVGQYVIVARKDNQDANN